jgi:cholesterol oxidase
VAGTHQQFDAVVIGSGFGGSVVALRLAEEGRSVLVLERGQPYPPGAFARSPHAMRSNFWAPEDERYGLFDLWAFDSLNVVVASGLGGGSLIYANVMLRKDESTFVREDGSNGHYENWPVTRAQLEPHYDRVEALQRPQRYPLGSGEPYDSTAKTRAMADAASELGWPLELPPLAIVFAANGGRPAPGHEFDDGSANLHGVPRSTCRLCGECDIGCNYGAKSTLDLTILSSAKRAGAQLRTCCEVRGIAPLAQRPGYMVEYRQHRAARERHRSDLLDPIDERTRRVETREVVLAAGTVGTTRLLLSNRAALPRLSPALGTRVSANGDYLAWVRNARTTKPDGSREWRYLEPSVGPVITASIAVSDDRSPSGRGFYLQDAGAPALADWMWQALELPADIWHARRTLLHRLRDRMRGRRDTHLSGLASQLLGDTHMSAAMMPLLGMGRDVANGRFQLKGDRLELDWSAGPSKDYYDALRDSFRALAEALGGEFTADPIDRRNRAITVHPVGGCPMATDPRRGVVDPCGRVFGHPGMWIADGSVMPGPVGANPSFTIAAVADRTAMAMLDPQLPAIAT